MRHQRRTAHALVAFALEEAQEHFADLIPAECLRLLTADRHSSLDSLGGRIPLVSFSVGLSHYCRGRKIPPLRVQPVREENERESVPREILRSAQDSPSSSDARFQIWNGLHAPPTPPFCIVFKRKELLTLTVGSR